MISALIATRGRPDSLRRSVESLRELAANPEAVEVVVAVGPDDEPSFRAATQLPDPAAVVIVPERYGYDQLYRYYIDLAKVATGDWLLLWNDDAFMTVRGWDAQITDLPLYGFPVMRRGAVE